MSKKIVVWTLMGFVFISMGYLIYSEVISPKNQIVGKNDSTTSDNTNLPALSSSTAQKNEDGKVIVYYFHGTFRCPTCRMIEEYTKEAVKEKFEKELDEGKIEIKTINVEEPENQHFIEDFKLITRCVVIERLGKNDQKEWTKLEKVWDYVHSSREEFFRYIQENIQKYLG